MTLNQIKKELDSLSIENLRVLGDYARELADEKRLTASKEVSVTKVKDTSNYIVSYKGKNYELKKHPRYIGFIVYELVKGDKGKFKRGEVVNKEFRGTIWDFRDAVRFGKI